MMPFAMRASRSCFVASLARGGLSYDEPSQAMWAIMLRNELPGSPLKSACSTVSIRLRKCPSM